MFQLALPDLRKKLAKRRWLNKNKEKHNNYNLQWGKNHRESCNNSVKKWRNKNKEKIAKYNKNYWIKNHERLGNLRKQKKLNYNANLH